MRCWVENLAQISCFTSETILEMSTCWLDPVMLASVCLFSQRDGRGGNKPTSFTARRTGGWVGDGFTDIQHRIRWWSSCCDAFSMRLAHKDSKAHNGIKTPYKLFDNCGDQEYGWIKKIHHITFYSYLKWLFQ